MILVETPTIITMIEAIVENTEYLDTSEGDAIACVGVENLCGILRDAGIISEKQAVDIQKETE